jgi:hypothetical protein
MAEESWGWQPCENRYPESHPKTWIPIFIGMAYYFILPGLRETPPLDEKRRLCFTYTKF